MTSRLTENFSLFQSKTFLDFFKNISSSDSLYAFTSDPLPINGDENNDIVPPNPETSQQNALRSVYDLALTAKKIEPTSASRATKRIDWVNGQTYAPYEADANVLDHDNIQRFYCVSEDVTGTSGTKFLNVYKCLYAPEERVNGEVRFKPSVDQPRSRDYKPFSTNDGYVWKYLYSITPFQETSFLTNSFLPVPEMPEDEGNFIEGTQDFFLNQNRQNATRGLIYYISVKDGGSGLKNGEYPVEVLNGLSDENPTSIFRGTAIVEGGSVQYVRTEAQGEGYSGAVNVRISDEAILDSDSVLPDIFPNISPGFGHGTDVPNELGANYVMINTRKYFDESDRGSVTRNDFRTISIVKNPIDERTGSVALGDYYDMTYKMQFETGVEGISEDSFLQKTTPEGTGATKESLVVGIGAAEGSSEGSLVSVIPTGAVFPDGAVDTSKQPRTGEFYRLKVTESQSPLSADSVVSFRAPFIIPYSGEVLQIEHRKPLNRTELQIESYNFVFVF